MSAIELLPYDTQILLTYARRKFAEECYPLSPELRDVQAALLKLRTKPAPLRPGPARPYVPSMAAEKTRKNRR